MKSSDSGGRHSRGRARRDADGAASPPALRAAASRRVLLPPRVRPVLSVLGGRRAAGLPHRPEVLLDEHLALLRAGRRARRAGAGRSARSARRPAFVYRPASRSALRAPEPALVLVPVPARVVLHAASAGQPRLVRLGLAPDYALGAQLLDARRQPLLRPARRDTLLRRRARNLPGDAQGSRSGVALEPHDRLRASLGDAVTPL